MTTVITGKENAHNARDLYANSDVEGEVIDASMPFMFTDDIGMFYNVDSPELFNEILDYCEKHVFRDTIVGTGIDKDQLKEIMLNRKHRQKSEDVFSKTVDFTLAEFLFNKPLPKTYEVTKSDAIRPEHYGGDENPFEPIKIIEYYNLEFSLGNAIKYILRAGKKDQSKYVEDLQRAVQYLNFEIKRKGGIQEPDYKQLYTECRSLLDTLVELKQHKTQFGETDLYKALKPLAWRKAKDFLNSPMP